MGANFVAKLSQSRRRLVGKIVAKIVAKFVAKCMAKSALGCFPLEPSFRKEIPRFSPILGHFKLSGRQFDDPKYQEKPKKT